MNDQTGAATEVSKRLEADFVLSGGRMLEGVGIDIGFDGRIVAVGPRGAGQHVERVERFDGILLPGLVNSHAHSPMTMLRSVGDGADLHTWLRDHIWPREARMQAEHVYSGMALGAAEMLLAGVTTSCEMYHHEGALVEAAVAAGLRLVVTPTVFSGMLVNGDPSNRLDEIDELREVWDDHKLVTVGYGPHSVYNLSPDALQVIASRAVENDALVHIHLEETEEERDLVLSRYGMTATQVLEESGVLSAKLLAAHGVWLSSDDVQILSDAGAGVAHCPTSNLKLGSGIAEVTLWLDKELSIGIGTDGPASNDDLDLWEDLRLAALLSRGSERNAGAMTATTAMRLATTGSASVIGLPNVGSLERGNKADIIHVDLSAPSLAPGLPEDLMAHLVFAGTAHHVRNVWVGGERVVNDRQLLNIDLEKVIGTVRNLASDLKQS